MICCMLGSFKTLGGISKKECQDVIKPGNFMGIFRLASSIICGEIIGRICFEKQAAKITPDAPLGELSPAKIALVSRKTVNFFGILFSPNLVSGSL